MPEELKIIIEADVSQAQAALNGIQDSATKTASSLKQLPAAANTGLSALSQQAKIVTLSVSKLGDTIETLRAKTLAKKEFLNVQTDITKIAALNKEIQLLEAEIVRVQSIGKAGFDEFGRAVAGSSDKIVAGFGNAFGAIRRLAFILPGIGIAGLFDAAFTGFSKLVDAIGSSNFGVPRFKELINSVEGAKDEFIKASVAVNTLKDEIQLAKDGFISKNDVVKKYNETIGKTTGVVKTLDEAEQALNKNADAYIQFTLLKAAANVALGKSAELAFQAALQNQKDLERISKITADKEGIGEFIKSGEDNLRKAEQESFNKRVSSLKDIANNFLKEAGQIKKQFNFNFFDDSKTDQAKKGLDEVQRKMIELAKAAEKVFNVPLKLRFDDTDLSETKLKKAKDVLQGIKDFVIKARVDIALPDIKELPKEQVDKIFVNIPNALRDAINKGLIEVPKDQQILIDAQVGPFAKEIQDVIDQFNREGFKIPVTFDLKDADLLVELKASFKGFQDAVSAVKKISFSELITQLEIVGAKGREAGRQAEAAFLKAGGSVEGAVAAGKAAESLFVGISKDAATAAQLMNSTLTPAFTGLFDAILQGKDPLQAFFQSLIHGIEQLIGKLIAAAVQAAILAAITGGTSSFGSILGKLFGFAEGGEPPVNKPSIVGEKGWELFVPKVPGTIYSHEDSVKMLTSASVKSSSVKESETIREYLIATKVSQLIKEHLSSVSIPAMVRDSVRLIVAPIESKLSETVKSITANNDKLTAYSYKLHESTDRTNNSIVSLRESFNSDATEKIVSSFKDSLKDSTFKDYSEKTIQAFTNSFTDTAVSKSESVQSPQISHDLSNITTSIKDAVASTVSTTIKSITASTDKLTAYVYKLHDSMSSTSMSDTSEKAISSVKQRHSDKELSTATFEKLISSFRQTFTSDTANTVLTSFKESFKDSTTSGKLTELITLFKESSSDSLRHSLRTDALKETASIKLYENVLKQLSVDMFTASLSTDKAKELFTSHASDSFEKTGFDKLISSITVKHSEHSDSDKVTSTFSDLYKLVSQFTTSSSTELVKLFSSFKDSTSSTVSAERFNSVSDSILNTIKDSFAINDSSSKETDNNTESFKNISASFSKIITTYTDKIKDSSFVSDNNTELIKLFTLLKDSSVSNSSGFERFNTVSDKTVSFKDSSKQSYDRLIERLFKDISTDSHTTTNSYEGFAEALKENLFKQTTSSHDKLTSSATYDSLIDKLKTSTFSTDKHTSFSGSVSSLNTSIEKLYSVARSDSSNNEILSDSSQSDRLSTSRIEKYIATQKDFIHDTASVIEKLVSSFVSTTGKEFSHKADVSSRSVISISDHSVKIADTFRQSIAESFSKIFSHSDSNESKEYFEQIRSIIQERGFERTLKELLRESFSESKIISSDKFIQSLVKDIYKTDKSDKSTSDRSFRQLDLFDSEKSITTDKSESFFKTVLNNLTRSTDHSKQVFDKISERINERLTINTIKTDKLTDKFHSVHVEKIVNNNFFSESFSSSKEFMKSMSLEKFGKMFNIPAFAQGGAVFGPTLAILGEGFGISRSNPEFVGTASQLKGIQGGSFDVNVNVNGDISFDMGKLAVALNRQERSHIRTNGKKPF